ncbi:LytTR family DNA-binding domain-containing protein [Maritimibacter sp. 55A14]|uniref:LytTR family DNA-binding domain-containing protein n=1 Tax=Maritimibacter sp. 55A14 TaxID=2174844 RepID=UPI001304ADEF|nr:LytTR family DNA-binding domain-containing protein [Maritimibacter sp. 55A14]
MPVPLSSWLLGAFIASLAGPFGTYHSLPWLERAAYWFAVIGGGMVLGRALLLWTEGYMPDDSYWRPALARTFAFTAIYTMILVYVHRHVIGWRPEETLTVGEIATVCFTLAFGVNVIRFLILSTQEPELEGPRLLRRLEPHMKGTILRLSGRDHYVDVHTDAGVTQILMRFSDALDELDGIDGHQVHRSHWVARHAVSGSEKAQGRDFLVLVDGARVPVSRSYRDSLKDTGLL